MSKITSIVFRNMGNVAMSGIYLLGVTIIGQMSRQQCNKTFETIIKDAKFIKTTFKDMRVKNVI